LLLLDPTGPRIENWRTKNLWRLVGRRLLKKLPPAMHESMRIGQHWAADRRSTPQPDIEEPRQTGHRP
jgi:hypothetical protein